MFRFLSIKLIIIYKKRRRYRVESELLLLHEMPKSFFYLCEIFEDECEWWEWRRMKPCFDQCRMQIIVVII